MYEEDLVGGLVLFLVSKSILRILISICIEYIYSSFLGAQIFGLDLVYTVQDLPLGTIQHPYFLDSFGNRIDVTNTDRDGYKMISIVSIYLYRDIFHSRIELLRLTFRSSNFTHNTISFLSLNHFSLSFYLIGLFPDFIRRCPLIPFRLLSRKLLLSICI